MRKHKIKMIALLIVLVMLVGGCFSAVGDESFLPEEDYFIVTLSVRVDTLLGSMNILDREKHELVPDDGMIFPATDVRAVEGDSVFDVLQREMRHAGIHLAFRVTPFIDSAYVEAINNIYEFDAGELSGWKYIVNSEFPGISSSQYYLSPGDIIEWVYSIDLGRDIGAGSW